MKILCLVGFLLALVGVSFAVSLADEEASREERQAAAIAGTIAKIVLPIVLDVGKAFIKMIIERWQDPDNVDIVILGRAIRIHKDNDHQVTATDKASGLGVTLQGATVQDATNKASQQLIAVLYQKGIVSKDDLHRPPTIPPTTLPPCVDTNGRGYCGNMAAMGYCETGNVFYTFMNDNCRRTCSSC